MVMTKLEGSTYLYLHPSPFLRHHFSSYFISSCHSFFLLFCEYILSFPIFLLFSFAYSLPSFCCSSRRSFFFFILYSPLFITAIFLAFIIFIKYFISSILNVPTIACTPNGTKISRYLAAPACDVAIPNCTGGQQLHTSKHATEAENNVVQEQ
jgi:hypothetical protein